jgi:hypothetical protein
MKRSHRAVETWIREIARSSFVVFILPLTMLCSFIFQGITKEDLAISRIQVSTALWLLFMNKSCFKKNENKIQQLLD